MAGELQLVAIPYYYQNSLGDVNENILYARMVGGLTLGLAPLLTFGVTFLLQDDFFLVVTSIA